jgi:hypothetical protein
MSLSLLFLPVTVFYSLQHRNYIYCEHPDKPNVTSQGRAMLYVTSVVLNNLLPFSHYDITVTAYTVKEGANSIKTGQTLELGNLYNLCMILILMDIHFYIAFGLDVRNPRWRETVCVCVCSCGIGKETLYESEHTYYIMRICLRFYARFKVYKTIYSNRFDSLISPFMHNQA